MDTQKYIESIVTIKKTGFTRHTVDFWQIKVGSFFLLKEMFFFKLDKNLAVCLNSARQSYFCRFDPVVPVDVELEIYT